MLPPWVPGRQHVGSRAPSCQQGVLRRCEFVGVISGAVPAGEFPRGADSHLMPHSNPTRHVSQAL